ncbi:MAG: hypothetical protein ISQ14_16095, partial [Verrucomicrobiae bacterium]|nr:hypothetical protein [Verrucomicrobiae bacterium]
DGANAADLNRDGQVDLIYGPHWYAGPDFKQHNEFYPAKPQPTERYANSFFTWPYDFDGNGRTDLLIVGQPRTPAYLYENPGGEQITGMWKRHQVFADDLSPPRPRQCRVPLIVKWPGVAKAGSVVSDPVTSTDLYPTCLAAAELPARPNQHQDGVNLRPVLVGEGSLAARLLFWHYPHYNEHPSSVPSSVIRKGSWKLIETFDPEGIELYNLASDISETKNVAATETAKTSELRHELESWRVAVGAERMLPNPDYDPSVQPSKKKKKREVE